MSKLISAEEVRGMERFTHQAPLTIDEILNDMSERISGVVAVGGGNLSFFFGSDIGRSYEMEHYDDICKFVTDAGYDYDFGHLSNGTHYIDVKW